VLWVKSNLCISNFLSKQKNNRKKEYKMEMKAIIVESSGGVDKLKLDTTLKPEPTEEEILVEIKAASLNRADILQRMGKYPPPPGASEILGMDIAGEVSAIGKNVSQWKPGDKVFGLVSGGGYAEYAVIHQDMAMPIPGNLNFIEAVAIPEVFLTAYQALFLCGQLKAGENVLIHAGASGVGTAAIELAKAVGTKVFVTATKEKHKYCLDLGADAAVDYKAGPFAPKVKELTNGEGVDVIIDFIAGPYFKQNVECFRMDGRLVILASLGGGEVDKVDLRTIHHKRITIVGSTLRNRSLEYRINLTKNFADFALEKFKAGKLKPVIDKIFDWKDAGKAHEYMEQNKNVGKIVLEIR
jgi:putative PIG3 family NAD(P)H quinone oxidoreductase